MTENLDFILDRLESNGAVFQALLSHVSSRQAAWKPLPEKWSLLEVINHLADEEVEDFGTRLRLVLENPGQDWPPIDPQRWAIDRQYNTREIEGSLDRFVGARRTTVEWLRSLHYPDWNKVPTYAGARNLRAGDLLCSWLAHDLIHIRQINRLHFEYLSETAAEFATEYAGKW